MRILIVEDQLMFREVVSHICSQCGRNVAGTAENGGQAIALARKVQPDVLILDLGLPDIDGFEVAERCLEILPTVRIIVLSCRLNPYTVYRVDQLGLNGFIDKSTSQLTILREAFAALDQGAKFFSPAFRTFRETLKQDVQSVFHILSNRELVLLPLIGQGLSDDEISRRLRISAVTVQNHRSNLLRKLGLNSTPKLMAFAQRLGFARIAD